MLVILKNTTNRFLKNKNKKFVGQSKTILNNQKLQKTETLLKYNQLL